MNYERSAMPLHTQALPPEILAIWVRTLRAASNLSQDALAEASNLSERTIQRIESSGRANQMTRRSLARGFGYDNHDIFDDPMFIATAIDAVAEIHAERAKKVEAEHPGHIKLAVEPVSSGAEIAGIIDRCDAWVYHCDDAASEAGKGMAAMLFDNVQDYGDIWNEIPPSGRFEAQGSFTNMLEDIAGQGLCALQAFRSAHLAPVTKGQAPMPFNIGYLTVVPLGQVPSHILVPKRF
jgi:transcriptional regulator with XRE-family HTH domain